MDESNTGPPAATIEAEPPAPRTTEYKAPAVLEQGIKVSNYKAGTDEAKRNEQKLMKLIKNPVENSKCAECTAPLEFRTAWASINLGALDDRTLRLCP